MKLHKQDPKTGRMVGKDYLYKSAEEFAEAFESYCEHCDATGEKPTIPNLAWHLGFASKQSIYEYGRKPEFEYIVGRCRLFCEKFFAQQLADGRGDAGVIFALKQFGWTDKQQHEVTGAGGGAQEHKWQVEFINAEAKD